MKEIRSMLSVFEVGLQRMSMRRRADSTFSKFILDDTVIRRCQCIHNLSIDLSGHLAVIAQINFVIRCSNSNSQLYNSTFTALYSLYHIQSTIYDTTIQATSSFEMEFDDISPI